MKMADPGEVGQYDVILLFGGIYASGISGLSFLKKHINQWKDKKIAVFCVGASPWDETAFQAVKKHNMKGLLEKIPVFYGRGSLGSESYDLCGPDALQYAAEISGKK